MSKIIKIEEIEAGMALAEPVINKQGQLLIAAGIKLEEKHKKILTVWGIRNISILTDEEDSNPSIPQSYYDYAKSELEQKMTWELSNEMEQEIFDIGVEIIAKKKYSLNNKKN